MRTKNLRSTNWAVKLWIDRKRHDVVWKKGVLAGNGSFHFTCNGISTRCLDDIYFSVCLNLFQCLMGDCNSTVPFLEPHQFSHRFRLPKCRCRQYTAFVMSCSSFQEPWQSSRYLHSQSCSGYVTAFVVTDSFPKPWQSPWHPQSQSYWGTDSTLSISDSFSIALAKSPLHLPSQCCCPLRNRNCTRWLLLVSSNALAIAAGTFTINVMVVKI